MVTRSALENRRFRLFGGRGSETQPAAAKTAAPASRKETASKQTKPVAKARKPEAQDGSKKGAVIELLR
jgi:hypothetical protein